MAKVKTKKHEAHGARYRNDIGRILPSVTGITGLVNKPALIHKAWELGIEGLDYREVWGEAAKIGTITHLLVECFLKNVDADLAQFAPAHVEAAQIAFQNFPVWWKSEGFTLIESEYRMSSEAMQCGGTLDIVAENVLQELWDVDIKTSKGVFPEMLYQQAAYWAMWNENHPDRPMHGVIILQLNKESGKLTPHIYNNLFRELEIFRHLRMVYGLMRKDDKAALARLMRKFNLERI